MASSSETQGLLVGAMRYFRRESLLQELKNPRELFLTKRVPEVVEIGPADWPERSFYGQSAGRISTTSGTRLVRTSSQGSSALEVNFRAENIASPRQVAPGSPRMIWPKP